MSTVGCPSLVRLRQLIAGKLADDALTELSAHLDGCAICRGTLDQLLALSDVWPIPAAPGEPIAPGPALAKVLDQLLQSPDPPSRVAPAYEVAEEELLAKTSETPVTQPSLSFLEPTDKAGYLGRLDIYEVTRILGLGGMGMVLQAFDPNLHRFVAVKVLAAHLACHPAARRRFIREARAAAAINHQHVVAIHAVHVDGPLPYLTMEYVPGVSLQQRLDQADLLTVEEILRIGRQVALGLAAAHAQGLIHRDVKPANILLENGMERIKLTDFGLARAVDDASMTSSGVIVGTPLYMSPEQARNESLDQRADLFSLGSVLYAMCVGRPPFRAQSSVGVLQRICEDTPHPIRDLNPAVPEWLCAIIARLHTKNPEDRFQSAQEVANVLGRRLAQLQQANQMPEPASEPRPTPQETKPQPSQPGRWWLGVLVLVLGGMASACWHLGNEWFQRGQLEPYVAPKLLIKRESKQLPKETPRTFWEPLQEMPKELSVVEWPFGKPARFTLDPVPTGEMVLLPDGRLLLSRVVGKPSALRLLDLSTGTEVYRLQEHTQPITALAVSRDGRLAVTGSEDQTVRLWDLENGGMLHCWKGHEATVRAVAIYVGDQPEQAKVFSASWNGRVRFWSVATGKELRRLDNSKGRLDNVIAAVFRPFGVQVVTMGDGGTLRSWWSNADESPKIYDVPLEGKDLHTFSREGHYFAHTVPQHMLGLHRVTPEYMPLYRLAGHTAEVTGLAFSEDRQYLLSGSRDRTVRLWSVDKGREVGKFEESPAAMLNVGFATDGKHFWALNATGTVWVWEWEAPP